MPWGDSSNTEVCCTLRKSLLYYCPLGSSLREPSNSVLVKMACTKERPVWSISQDTDDRADLWGYSLSSWFLVQNHFQQSELELCQHTCNWKRKGQNGSQNRSHTEGVLWHFTAWSVFLWWLAKCFTFLSYAICTLWVQIQLRHKPGYNLEKTEECAKVVACLISSTQLDFIYLVCTTGQV